MLDAPHSMQGLPVDNLSISALPVLPVWRSILLPQKPWHEAGCGVFAMLAVTLAPNCCLWNKEQARIWQELLQKECNMAIGNFNWNFKRNKPQAVYRQLLHSNPGPVAGAHAELWQAAKPQVQANHCDIN
jgi:hypothetical protein